MSLKRALAAGCLIVAGVFGLSPTLAGRGNTSEAAQAPTQGSTDAKTTADAPPPRKPGEDPFRHAPPSQEELDRLLKSGFATQVRVDRVLVPAVVTDKRGRPIVDLESKDFLLSEDKIPQKIDYFDRSQKETVSIAFLLDISGSMRLLDKIGEAREAIRFFLDGLGKGDQAAVLTFADGEVETLAPFGTRPDLILAKLQLVKAYGQTALNDAIAAAPTLVDEEQRGRKAIVLITDGIDNASKLSLFEAMSSSRRVDVPIYTIGFSSHSTEGGGDILEAGTNGEVLKMISVETGGEFFWITDPDELKEAIRSVEEDLRSQYVLGYTPPQTKCDGSFRRIDLKVGKGRYIVRTRKGYVAGPC